MNFGTILDDALTYTRNGIFNNVNRWVKLIIAILCLGLPMNGYVIRIYRGENPAPEVENWGSLFVDGLKLILSDLSIRYRFLSLWQLRTAALSWRHYPEAPDEWNPS